VTLARISLAYLKRRLLGTVLNIVLLAVAVASVTLLLLVSTQLEERIERDARGVDLVVGAKGSRVQLVLSTIYDLDVPGANVPWSDVQQIATHAGVKSAIPIILGDSYYGARIVGTTYAYPGHYGAVVKNGRLWERPLEAVLGADVHARTRASLGSTFLAAHGLADASGEPHGQHPYRIVGVLARTGTLVDQLVLTDLGSYWIAHAARDAPESELVAEPQGDDERGVSAVLVQYARDAAADVHGFVNSLGGLQGVSPARETAHLLGVVALNIDLLRGFAAVLLLSAALSIFLALYYGLNERRYDIAVMRTLGASRANVMCLLLFEGMLLALSGAIAGLVLGHVLTSIMGFALRRFQQMSVTGWVWQHAELWIVVLALAVGALAALIPAWRAHEVDIAATLARG
jgi:putative ABC transport system permease protein